MRDWSFNHLAAGLVGRGIDHDVGVKRVQLAARRNRHGHTAAVHRFRKLPARVDDARVGDLVPTGARHAVVNLAAY